MIIMCLIFRNTRIFFSYPAKLAPPSSNNGTDYDYDDEYYEEYDYEPYHEIQANSTGNTFRTKVLLIIFSFRLG